MIRGTWHQCGNRSQTITQELLSIGVGQGVIISPKDLSFSNAIRYSQRYNSLGSHVLFDPQFFTTAFTNTSLETYPINSVRTSIPNTMHISDQSLRDLTANLIEINSRLETSGIIAPAFVYEAGRPDIIDLNARLFSAAKSASVQLGLPTYATVFIGKSATNSANTIDSALSSATSLDPDGWYFSYEFANEGICSNHSEVLRFCKSGLKLACTGLPVLHAFAGPMSIMSFGFGTTAVGIGHFQNLWQFTRSRWDSNTPTGGDGSNPPRFFSENLWGKVIYPDDVVRLSPPVANQVLNPTPYSTNVSSTPPNLPWSHWDSHKHLLHTIHTKIANLASIQDAEVSAALSISHLNAAVQIKTQITSLGIALNDPTNKCQENWSSALSDLIAQEKDSFEYLKMI